MAACIRTIWRVDPDDLIEIGLAHLGRFAFFTRDNPFVSSRAALELDDSHRRILRGLLDGTHDIEAWLDSELARRLVSRIRIGCLPRDVQLVVRDEKPTVGVESVHAFLHAPLFWWLVSILWCITIGRDLDQSLPPAVKGYRLDLGFVDDPATSSVMYRDPKMSYRAWQRFPDEVSRAFPGEVLATGTIDLKDFFYSVQASPTAIVSQFLVSHQRAITPSNAHGQVLGRLLDELHRQFAQRMQDLQPRPLSTDAMPLPVGLPSSQILANLVLSTVIVDLASNPLVDGVATYADDVIIITHVLPELRESPGGFLTRLGLVETRDGAPPRLNSNRGQEIATLHVSLEKSATSYSRSADATPDEPDVAPDEARENVDPYVEGHASPDWGGRLRTVLRAPQRRDRVPRELARDLSRLVDEIRVGIDTEEIIERFERIRGDLDSGLFLALRPYWVEFLVIALSARGRDAVAVTTQELFVPIAEALEPPPEANDDLQDALLSGLRAAWIQALAQALAVTLSDVERTLLEEQHPFLFEGSQLRPVETAKVCAYADLVRERLLIPKTLVSAPLSEFTDWQGALIGREAFDGFLSWSADGLLSAHATPLLRVLPRAVRFIGLHEICLAVHLWAADDETDWLTHVFQLFAAQPLIQPELLEDLRSRADEMLSFQPPVVPESDEAQAQLQIRIAMPSMNVPSNQLEALLEEDSAALGKIAKQLRAAAKSLVASASSRHADVLVMPEWSLLRQQLVWLMDHVARTQMLVIGGGAPTLTNGTYSNLLWTGIPFTDAVGHRLCLVPPPRMKRYLSPHEREPLNNYGVTAAAAPSHVPSFGWRGLRFASLICFEFADIEGRSQLRATTDLLTVSSLNRDWRYFASIQEATTRDIYCLTVCVNTGDFPGTTIMRPTKNEMSVVASVHGSDHPTVVSRRVDLVPVVAARANRMQPSHCIAGYEPQDDVLLSDYKPFPPI